jgi:dihydroneopterin triphosphate aldolase (PTPS-III) / 6-pyruvoyltetrahydropterin synthase
MTTTAGDGQQQQAAAPDTAAADVISMNQHNQVIGEYQKLLAAYQSQLASSPNPTVFEIFVCKDNFKFNASHFVAFPGFRERLHGHSYRASVKLLGSHQIGRDGYVVDFGCVKSVAKDVCKTLNEYFLVPTLSEVLEITVNEDKDKEGNGTDICGEINTGGNKYPGSVIIKCEDGSTFTFPRQDCLLLPIMHSTAEELAVYIFGKVVDGLDSQYLIKRGVTMMEITVSEAVGQDAIFRHPIPTGEGSTFDVASFITNDPIPPMKCSTTTEAAR